MVNKCDECYWMYRMCSNEKSPNFLVAENQCTVKCDCFERKPKGLESKKACQFLSRLLFFDNRLSFFSRLEESKIMERKRDLYYTEEGEF